MANKAFHDWMQTVANATVIITLFGGLASFWYQYNQNKNERTLQLSGQVFEDPLLEAQREFVTELGKLPLEVLKGQSLSREFVAELISQVIAESADPESLRNNIITLVNYYDRVAACVSSDLCNSKLTLQQIDPAATRFACWVVPYVRAERDRLLLTGLGEDFASLVSYERRC